MPGILPKPAVELYAPAGFLFVFSRYRSAGQCRLLLRWCFFVWSSIRDLLRVYLDKLTLQAVFCLSDLFVINQQMGYFTGSQKFGW